MQADRITRAKLLAWLNDSSEAAAGADALRCSGRVPATVAKALRTVTEDPSTAASLATLVEHAKRRSGLPLDSVAIERWLLAHEAVALLSGPRMPRLGDTVLNLTCGEIASLVDNAPGIEGMLRVTGIRFREFAKMTTGRRFSAGLFHWDICGVRRSWLLSVPPRDIGGLTRALARLRGFGPVMFPHLNPRRPSGHLAEPAISDSLAAMAETLSERTDLRGFAAASWLRSPDVHRVSPHLAAVNAPILAGGGFVTTVGVAGPDCGVFERSRERARLYAQGRFKPTTGLVLWARGDMLRWWRQHRLAA